MAQGIELTNFAVNFTSSTGKQWTAPFDTYGDFIAYLNDRAHYVVDYFIIEGPRYGCAVCGLSVQQGVTADCPRGTGVHQPV